jgi:hypothetical protein
MAVLDNKVRISSYFPDKLKQEIINIGKKENRMFAPMLEILVTEAVQARKAAKKTPLISNYAKTDKIK